MSDLTQLLDSIRLAIDEGADAATRQRGAVACRAIAAALDATPGQPLATAPPPSSTLVAAVRHAGSAPPTLVLDALIAKLKTLLPEGAGDSPPTESPQLRIPFIQLPRGTR